MLDSFPSYYPHLQMRKQGKYWSQEAITFWITFISPRYLWKVEGLGKGGTCFFTGSKICAGKKDLRGGLSPTIPGLVPRAVYIQASHPILLNFCFYRALHDFLLIERLWPCCVEQVYWCHFSNDICSLHVSVSCFGDSYNISNFSLLLYLLMVICEQ